MTHVLTDISSFNIVISAKEEARVSSFPAATEATSSDFKPASYSSSETLSLRERSSASSDFFSLSACTKFGKGRTNCRHINTKIEPLVFFNSQITAQYLNLEGFMGTFHLS